MYHLTDQLGSVRDMVDESTGSLVGALDYSPYGQVLWDNNAGLSVSTTWLYDAGFARWMSRDPIREAGTIYNGKTLQIISNGSSMMVSSRRDR